MKKRFSYKLLTFLLIISIIVPNCFFGFTVHQVYAAWTGTVTANTLNVRMEASTTSDKLQLEDGTYVFLNKGETVTILGEKGDFYYVSLKFNGKTEKGYVHKDFIKVEVTPTPTVTPKPTATPTPNSSSKVAITKEVNLKGTVTATTLNVRSGPGTNYTKVAGLLKDDTVTILCDVTADDTNWYGISFLQNKVTVKGYVSCAYIKLSYSSSVKAEVSVSKLKVKSAAGSDASYLKQKGTVITLKDGKNITIIGETLVSDVKWFKISFTVNDKKYTGYVEAKQISFRRTVAKPTATPKPTAKPTAKPTVTPKPTVKPTTKPTVAPNPTVKPTPKPTVAPNPTVKPAPKPTVAPIPTVKPTPTPKPTVAPNPTVKPTIKPTIAPPAPTYIPTVGASGIFEVNNVTVYDNINIPVTGYVCNTFNLNVFSDVQNIALLYDDYSQPIVIQSAQAVTVTQSVEASGTKFYKVDFTYNGKQKTGYVLAMYIYINNSVSNVTPTPSPTSAPIDNVDFETRLKQEGFPKNYRDALLKLHEVYPNWVFEAYHTGLDWNTVISSESVPGRNVLYNSKGVEWKSLEKGAYDWSTDKFTVFDGTQWVTASKTAIEYYMDPRNFLNASGIFQFELLKFQSTYQNIAGVNKIIKGTALYDTSYSFTDENGVTQNYTYAETFMEAAKYSGVSPYHLASRVKQEVVTGPTTLSGSVSGTYSGYAGYFNFYNIGANDSAGGGAIANGLKFAKYGRSNAANNLLYMIPWTNPFRAIVGGSYFLGSGYVNKGKDAYGVEKKGQDTIYLQKFNVTPISTYSHQYMSNVEAPYAEGKKVLTAYGGMSDSPIVFSIPIYLNMPSTACKLPTTMYNPNNRMKSLSIATLSGTRLPLTPTFSQTVMNYNMIVDNSVDCVKISALAVSTKATVSGTGIVALNVGTNKFVIPVRAENGDVAKYTVTIIRSEAVATQAPTPTPTQAPTQAPTKAPTPAVTPSMVQ